MSSMKNHVDMYDSSIWGKKDVSSGKGVKDENFPVGSLLISKHLRPHVQAYYNFARVIDDIADSEILTSEEKVFRLDGMQAVLCDNIPAPDRADIMTARFLRNSLIETCVSFETATDLLIAFRQDAVKNRYETFAELLDYCRYSANPVGHYLLDLHKENALIKPASDALCTSLQILNHLQDCKTDLIKLNRCYIPLDMLRAEYVEIDAIRDIGTVSGLRNVFNYILDYVDDLNLEAERLVQQIVNRRLKMESSIILSLARFLTDHLRKEDPLATRVKLNYKDALKAMFYSFPHIL